jgi:hypothetical protein
VLGKEHPDTLTSMNNNVAAVLRDQGKYEQAEEMLRQARDGAGQRASFDADEHEQPGGSAEGSGQVRAGGRDVSASTRAMRDGAGQRAS